MRELEIHYSGDEQWRLKCSLVGIEAARQKASRRLAGRAAYCFSG